MTSKTIPSQSTSRLEETKRIGRVLQIVQLIQFQPRRHLRRDLAERFEVSTRQIDKDLELIRHGLLLDLRHDPAGYYFGELPSLPQVAYSFGEALALLLAAQAGTTVPGVDVADLAAAISRLESLFPEPLRHLLRKSALFSFDRLGSAQAKSRSPAEHRTEMLRLVNDAIGRGRKLRLTYKSASSGEERERTVQPYVTFLYVRSWHLVAFCELRQDVRLFKIDRIRTATTLEETYTVPADFDLGAYFGNGWGILRDTGVPVEDVVLEFEPRAARWVSEEKWHPMQQIEVRADGSAVFRVSVPVTNELVHWVLGYGPNVRVVSPKRLRAQIGAAARAMVAQCAEEDSSDD